MEAEERGENQDRFYAIAVGGHPGGGDRTSGEADETDAIAEACGDVEALGRLVEKVLSRLKALDAIHEIGIPGVAGAGDDDICSGLEKDFCEGNKLLRAIRETVEKHEDAFGFFAVRINPAFSLGAKGKRGFGFFELRKFLHRRLVVRRRMGIGREFRCAENETSAEGKNGRERQNQRAFHLRNFGAHAGLRKAQTRNPIPMRIRNSDKNWPRESPRVSGASGWRKNSPMIRTMA